MICQECQERPSTLHFTKIVNGEKTEIHLCDQCAQDKGDMFMFDGTPGFSVNNLLAGLLNMHGSTPKPAKENSIPTHDVLRCEKCSMTFQQFINIGRFGCAQCYDSFKERLNPVLRKIHSGNIEHQGKVPERIGGAIQVKRQISSLKDTLQKLIADEEFENAAKVRDEIRSLEKEMKQGGNES